ncbi:MAG: hypothetical protein DRH56_08135 [Deltaproteobacteria bacterium]|nr:MAG: hypothetical protein DRH56_08135 [Deltaproteobacteria bacterium]
MARKKRNFDEESGQDVGMVMTVSLFLILLTFFILLNSIAVIDDRRVRLSIGSLLGSFGSLSGGLSPSKTGELAVPPSPPMVEQGLTASKLLSLINKTAAGEIKFLPTADGAAIVLGADMLFEPRTLQLKPSAVLLLKRICDFVRDRNYEIKISGHTDSRPGEEKGYASNWELSSLMAIRVLEYITGEGGLKPERVEACGCAGYRPVAPNDTRESRRRNERVEMRFNFNPPLYLKRIVMKKKTGIFTYKRFNFRIF